VVRVTSQTTIKVSKQEVAIDESNVGLKVIPIKRIKLILLARDAAQLPHSYKFSMPNVQVRPQG